MFVLLNKKKRKMILKKRVLRFSHLPDKIYASWSTITAAALMK
jgi:hypothetical protein